VERLCLYEWAAAGGLEGPDGNRVATEPALADVVRREGVAMLATLARLAALLPRCTTRVLVGDGVSWEPPAGVELVRVPRGRERDALAVAAATTDWLLVVAPETAGILEQRLCLAHASTCRVVGPTAAFAALAADKHATIQALAAAGVPVPAGRLLRAGETPPAGFHLPMVRKARGSVGCDGVRVIHDRDQDGGPALGEERLEAFAQGLPISVSLLCGPAGAVPLPATMQRLSSGASPHYLGGRLPVPARLAARAERLAGRAVFALARYVPEPPDGPRSLVGWMGVDMILGDREDGREDRVLEVNPRVTTSLVGLAAFCRENLLGALLKVAGGEIPELAFDLPPADAPRDFAASPCPA
jgi:predicted ATP-grasp superfamily ATP-dependent carboligase